MTVVMTPDREPFLLEHTFHTRDGDQADNVVFSILKDLRKEFETDPKGVNIRARKITDDYAANRQREAAIREG